MHEESFFPRAFESAKSLSSHCSKLSLRELCSYHLHVRGHTAYSVFALFLFRYFGLMRANKLVSAQRPLANPLVAERAVRASECWGSGEGAGGAWE